MADRALDLAVAAGPGVGSTPAAFADIDDGMCIVAALGDQMAARLERFRRNGLTLVSGRNFISLSTSEH